MKIVTYYTGSDARWLTELFPTDVCKIPYILWTRVRAWLIRPIVKEYWVADKYLERFILRWNPRAKIRVVPDEMKYPVPVQRQKHDGINVMYYYPANEYNRTYCRWCYGKDIIEALVARYPQVNWIRVDGTADMNMVFPVIDLYIRPNRHDGHSRLVDECRLQGIPVYWSQHDPDMDVIEYMLQHGSLLKLTYNNKTT